jgi:hypothetical protein
MVAQSEIRKACGGRAALRAWMLLFIDHGKPDMGSLFHAPTVRIPARRLAALGNLIIGSGLLQKNGIGIGKRARVQKRRGAHCVSAMPLSKSSPRRTMTSAPAADLPTEAVNDKGRYHTPMGPNRRQLVEHAISYDRLGYANTLTGLPQIRASWNRSSCARNLNFERP